VSRFFFFVFVSFEKELRPLRPLFVLPLFILYAAPEVQ